MIIRYEKRFISSISNLRTFCTNIQGHGFELEKSLERPIYSMVLKTPLWYWGTFSHFHSRTVGFLENELI